MNLPENVIREDDKFIFNFTTGKIYRKLKIYIFYNKLFSICPIHNNYTNNSLTDYNTNSHTIHLFTLLPKELIQDNTIKYKVYFILNEC